MEKHVDEVFLPLSIILYQRKRDAQRNNNELIPGKHVFKHAQFSNTRKTPAVSSFIVGPLRFVWNNSQKSRLEVSLPF